MTRILAIVGLLLVGFLVGKAQAADPLPLQIADAQAFRHVLEDNDWLILGRLYLVPDTSIGNTDTFTVATTGGDFDDPIVLTNRVVHKTAADFIVTETGVPTALTSFCTLGQDDQTIDCEGTGLADGSYTVVVEYRMGWDAYTQTDVFVRLVETATVRAERSAPSGTYSLAGVYLTAADVTTLGITYGDRNIVLNALASPNLWAVPADEDVVIMWDLSTTQTATAAVLTTQLQAYLTQLELADPAISSGDYVSVGGITRAGAVVANRAFPRFQSAIPTAFVSFELDASAPLILTPKVSVITAVEQGRATSTVFITFGAIHPAAGGFVTFLISLLVAGGMWVSTKSIPVAGGGWFVVIFAGWLMFNLPFQLVFITAAAIIAVGFMWVGKAVFD